MSRLTATGVAGLLTVIAVSVASASGPGLVAVSRPSRGSARLVYLSTDAAAGLTKGAGTDAGNIAAEVIIVDENGTTRYEIPGGAVDGVGWVANDAGRAAFANPGAPGGPSGVRRLIIVVGRRARIVAESLGDVSPLTFGAAPSADVAFACIITNGGELATHCTRFAPADCTYTPLDGGTGWKLRCRNGVPDPTCAGNPSTTTTSTLPPTTCGNGIRDTGEECDGGPACTTDCRQDLPSCCVQTHTCISAPLFSLIFNLMSYCAAMSPGSTALPGGVCASDGTCASQPVDPVPVCCQQAAACLGGIASSTQQLWYAQYDCNLGAGIGNGPYIVVNAVCGADGLCVRQ